MSEGTLDRTGPSDSWEPPQTREQLEEDRRNGIVWTHGEWGGVIQPEEKPSEKALGLDDVAGEPEDYVGVDRVVPESAYRQRVGEEIERGDFWKKKCRESDAEKDQLREAANGYLGAQNAADRSKRKETDREKGARRELCGVVYDLNVAARKRRVPETLRGRIELLAEHADENPLKIAGPEVAKGLRWALEAEEDPTTPGGDPRMRSGRERA